MELVIIVEFNDIIEKNKLLKNIFSNTDKKFLEIKISGITNDSRQVKNNFIFVAVKGVKDDGNNYVEKAKLNGASIIISNKIKGEGIIKIDFNNILTIYSLLCSAYYPKKPSNLIGVTGTNGKTSVVEFCRQIWNLAGWKSASMGTLGINSDELKLNNLEFHNLTTFEPSVLHKNLSILNENNISHVSLEASSHGIHQKRLIGINFSGGVFTNLTHDHLDYHKTFKNYFETKKSFFIEYLLPGSVVSINLDDKYGKKIYDEIIDRPYIFVNYGKNKLSDLRILELSQFENFWQIKIEHKNEIIITNVGMLGEFQVYNALASAAICIGLNMDAKFVLKSLSYLKSAPGRMQILEGHPKNAIVVIDYAHTPDALEVTLRALRNHAKGKIYTLFGCGGDRDKKKRKLMGIVSDKYSDFTIITDDNPRNESPRKIRKAIKDGCPNAIEISGRDQAIKKSISLLNDKDILLIAGKGHENYQTIGMETLPFDDFSTAKTAINNLKNE